MKEEDKKLLLKDICASLPYLVKISIDSEICTLIDIDTELGDELNGETYHIIGYMHKNNNYDFAALCQIKPYLRPMSSMTEDELYDYTLLLRSNGFGPECWDWLNARHFDYRGLIENELALEAPEGMYKTE